jgi:acetylornithine deacetylase/succinyl-diaminopimelate desuccinylase-like protein
MLADAQDAAIRAAHENDVTVEFTPIWRIEPRPFDTELIELCTEAVRDVTGDAPRLPSGPLHDAAEMVPHMPVVMMFAYSSRGLSHCKEEDTPEPYLAKTIEAFQLLVDKAVTSVAGSRT